ncbi:hypothetical protein J6590_011792 [Homalodisca vitripennis]|nr:hypothetical protein J6590_011792 [Homalodisca vitripennis]
MAVLAIKKWFVYTSTTINNDIIGNRTIEMPIKDMNTKFNARFREILLESTIEDLERNSDGEVWSRVAERPATTPGVVDEDFNSPSAVHHQTPSCKPPCSVRSFISGLRAMRQVEINYNFFSVSVNMLRDIKRCFIVERRGGVGCDLIALAHNPVSYSGDESSERCSVVYLAFDLERQNGLQNVIIRTFELVVVVNQQLTAQCRVPGI